MILARFEEWVEVDCNDCARYWDSSCDGLQGSPRPCTAFLATRSVVLPSKIKCLENSLKWLSWGLLIESIAFVLHMVSHIAGWV